MIECNSRLVSADFSFEIIAHFINSFGITPKHSEEGDPLNSLKSR